MNQPNKWQQELDKLTDTAFKQTDSELFNLYRNKLIEIKKVVKHYTDIYPDLSFSKKLEIERQLQVGAEIQNILASVDKDVHQSVKDFAVNQGNLGYNGVFYAMEGAENITTPMTVINQKYIVNALNKPVAGKRLSTRLYQNRNHLSKVANQALIDGLWDGNGYAEVAKRITDQTEASYRQSLRIARTEGGRVRSVTTQQGYDDAADMGIEFEKEWLATSDNRTRHDHTLLNGQRVGPDEEFEVRGNHAVGPRLFGIAREDINCRCTTVSVVKDVPDEFKSDENSSMVQDNYEDWVKGKKSEGKKFDVNSATRKELVNRIENSYNMSISETSKTKLSDLALRETIKTIDRFGDLYNKLPDKIPTLKAVSKSKGKDAIAWYASYTESHKPVEFGVNVGYFNNGIDELKEIVEHGVRSGWFSNNADTNHIMVHEFGHHIDGQLTKLMNERGITGSFNDTLFSIIKADNPEFEVSGISQYASNSFVRSGKYTEAFAEYVAEAYGSTPGIYAKIFKKYLELSEKELLK